MSREEVHERLGGVTGLGEDDDPFAVLDAQRLGQQHPRLAEFGV